MNKPGMRRRQVQEVVLRRPREVSLVPVFRYREDQHHGRTWLWVTGAAVLVAVAILLPQII